VKSPRFEWMHRFRVYSEYPAASYWVSTVIPDTRLLEYRLDPESSTFMDSCPCSSQGQALRRNDTNWKVSINSIMDSRFLEDECSGILSSDGFQLSRERCIRCRPRRNKPRAITILSSDTLPHYQGLPDGFVPRSVQQDEEAVYPRIPR
jgi:hypothetical protein